MTDPRDGRWAARLLFVLVAAGCARPIATSTETLYEFRRMTTALLSSEGNFNDAAHHLSNMDYLGETSAVGKCMSFAAQELDIRQRLRDLGYVLDVNPSYLPHDQLPICRAYRRERSCSARRCEITDAVEICLHTDPEFDQCRFTRATSAGSFHGVDWASAISVHDDEVRRGARDVVEAATLARSASH